MRPWLKELEDDLARLDAQHLRRRLVPAHRAATNDGHGHGGRWIERDGQSLLNFASNDYLALSDHPALKQAAKDAIDRYGTGAGASRLVTGHLPIHGEIESRFAAFKHAEAALLCPTGYLANLAVLTTLARPGDLVCIDKLCHASLIDAAHASGATVRVFPHLNYDKLQRLLERFRIADFGFRIDDDQRAAPAPPNPKSEIRNLKSSSRAFIVTDSVFSMDGDCADLPALCDLAEKHGAILVVDEAHGTGVFGATGAGLCEAQGVANRVDIVVSTASKALGGLGGIVTARRVVIDTLINHARSFIFTTAVPAAQAATIGAALDVIRSEPWRRTRVMELAAEVRSVVAECGFGTPPAPFSAGQAALQSPIIPIITGTAQSALALAAHLARHGIHAPAIRPPTVALSAARVRLSLRADMAESDIDRLRETLRSADRVSSK